jgi:hypothetical protein
MRIPTRRLQEDDLDVWGNLSEFTQEGDRKEVEASDIIMNERLHTYKRHCLQALAKGVRSKLGGRISRKERRDE